MSDLAKKLDALNAEQTKKLAVVAGIKLDASPTKAEARAALEELDPAVVEAALAALESDGKQSDQPKTEGNAGTLRPWRVSLKHMPSHVVEAVDAADAIAKYKKHMGVITSEHPFQAGPVEDAAEA